MIKELKQEAQNLTVLFVDDDPSFLSIQKELLDNFFAKVETALDGEEGLLKYRAEGSFDLVITDLTMPKMSGLAMSSNIKMTNPSQYILAVSAHSDSDKLISAIDIGVDSFLLKPVDNTIFLERLLKISQAINASLSKEREMELERALIRQGKMASMGEMIGVISHQLKQPLSAINLLALNIKKFSDPSNDNIHKNAKLIMQQVSFMSSTIDAFANFLKPSKMAKSFFLKESISDVLCIMSTILSAKNIEASQDIDQNILLFGHQKELNQVILNIISNATDAFCNNNEKRTIFINAHSVDTKVFLSIEDNAGGVCQDVLNHIFEPYITTKGEKGTGLGLHIAKKIVEDHFGGTIRVENTDVGAKFIIELQSQKSASSAI